MQRGSPRCKRPGPSREHPNKSGKVELFKLMEELARRELNEIHVEAGTKLNGSLLQAE